MADLLSLFPAGSALADDGTLVGRRLPRRRPGRRVRHAGARRRRAGPACQGTRVRRRARRSRWAELTRGVRVEGVPVHGGPAGDGRGGSRARRGRWRRDPHRAQGGRRPGAGRAARQRQERRGDRDSRSSTASGWSWSTTPTTSTGSRPPFRTVRPRTCWCGSSPGVTADTHAHVLTGSRGLEVRARPRRRGAADQAHRAELATADAGPARARRLADPRGRAVRRVGGPGGAHSASSRSTTSVAGSAPATPGPTTRPPSAPTSTR